MCGCHQWLATQCRPEVAAAVSLTPHGGEAQVSDLKSLYVTMQYVKDTPEQGLMIPCVPLNQQSIVAVYSDSSWNNARKSGSQIGTLTGITTPEVFESICSLGIVDWKSSRSPRVCRSTLASEATAADEAADRGMFLNLFLSELMWNIPAHRVGSRLRIVHAVDAKSLYDAVIAENPNLNDRRTLVSIRSIQEQLPHDSIRWVPTQVQFSDGLTKIDTKLRDQFGIWLQNPHCILTSDAQTKEKHTDEGSEPCVSYCNWHVHHRPIHAAFMFKDP